MNFKFHQIETFYVTYGQNILFKNVVINKKERKQIIIIIVKPIDPLIYYISLSFFYIYIFSYICMYIKILL